jgi:hypothetical protein
MKNIILIFSALLFQQALHAEEFIRDVGTYQFPPKITLIISTNSSNNLQYDYKSAGSGNSGSLEARRGEPILFYYDKLTEKLWYATPNGVGMLSPGQIIGYRWGSVLPGGVPISPETVDMMHLPHAPEAFKEEVKRIYHESPIP